jgi:DNA-binding MarR family transcriptional regulator
MQPDTHSPTIDFLVRLRIADKRGLTLRDILVLYAVMTNPGISGVEIMNKIGLENRSGVQTNIMRLLREGYMEDRRIRHRKAEPVRLYILPLGTEFWNQIKPQ